MGKRGKKGKQGSAKGKQTSENAARKSAAKPASDSSQGGKYSVDQLLDKAEEYIDTFEFEMAHKFCARALEIDPDNTRVLQTSGTLLLELGDMENAKTYFGRAIQLEPERGHSKYMYMGQLLTGLDAIQCYLMGIKLMKKELEEQSSVVEGATSADQSSVSSSDISQAHCNIAEIYLTDACFEENAEDECRKNLEAAIETDPSNPEAHHLMASFWLSKDDKEKATECLSKGISLWLPNLKKVHSEDDTEASEVVDPVVACPVSYPGRINAAKLCIEVGNYEQAAEILELLLDEDDEVLEVWYLLGWSNHLQGEEFKSTARFYLQKAQKVAKKVECDDKQMVAHVQELLEELGPDEEEEEDAAENGEDEDDMETDGQNSNDEDATDTSKPQEENSMEH